MLLHGWSATADLNWHPCFGPLSKHFRVLAMDHRGHGRGLHGDEPFRLEDCADDVAAVADQLGIERMIAVGYSMGGPIAQLLWRRHPEQVAGLVLCATGYRFVMGARERVVFSSMMATAAGTTRAGHLLSRAPAAAVRRWAPRTAGGRPTDMRRWAAGEMRRHDLVKIMEAGQAIGSYNARGWIGEIDVPTTVLVMERDRAVAPADQRKLAAMIPGAVVHALADGHMACAQPEFGPAVVRAIDSVRNRLAR
jgi:pimeloyl-ACP methyl ester carboxylesterase